MALLCSEAFSEFEGWAAAFEPTVHGLLVELPVLPDLLAGHSAGLNQLVEGRLEHLKILREARDGYDLGRRRNTTRCPQTSEPRM